jgi:hypothetical protein
MAAVAVGRGRGIASPLTLILHECALDPPMPPIDMAAEVVAAGMFMVDVASMPEVMVPWSIPLTLIVVVGNGALGGCSQVPVLVVARTDRGAVPAETRG